MFKQKLYEINWEEVVMNQNSNGSLQKFSRKNPIIKQSFFPVISKRLKKPLDNNWNKEIF